MQFEKLWEFSDAQAMPNNTTAVCTNICDWTSSIYVPWINSGVDLWLVVTVNTVPGAGTSLAVLIYQHTTTSIGSGDLLLSGADIAIAKMSANPLSRYHYLLAVPFSACFCGKQNADLKQYFGLVLSATGDVSTGAVDAHLRVGKPPVPTVQVTTSNI